MPAMKSPLKESATITMNASVLERIRETARVEKRTLSQQLEMLVEKHFGQSAVPTSSHHSGGKGDAVMSLAGKIAGKGGVL